MHLFCVPYRASTQKIAHRPVQKGIYVTITADTAGALPHLTPFGSIIR